MAKKKHARYTFMITLLALTLALHASAFSVSPALDIIANEYGLTKVSLVSRDVYFESSDFSEVTGLDKIDYITVKALPDQNAGTLMIGNIAIGENQKISSKNLSNLRFVPRSSNEIATSFTFSTNNNAATYTCSVYLLERDNAAPSIQSSAGNSLSTYKSMPVFGKLKAHDPENDPLTFKIISAPLHGKLELTDKTTGSFSYTPENGYSGIDFFEYAAYDKYANVSETARVSLNVLEPQTNIVFSDLEGHWAHYAAIRTVACGAMSFESEGGVYNFMPDLPVSRAEFCASLMKNAGYNGFSAVSSTGYADDEDIPEEYKGYIAAASVLGVTSGIEADGNLLFCPNNQITRAEAAVMIERLYGFSNDVEVSSNASVAVFADASSVPVWAHESIGVLSNLGILSGDSYGNISPYAGLTRAQTAVMLSNISDNAR